MDFEATKKTVLSLGTENLGFLWERGVLDFGLAWATGTILGNGESWVSGLPRLLGPPGAPLGTRHPGSRSYRELPLGTGILDFGTTGATFGDLKSWM